MQRSTLLKLANAKKKLNSISSTEHKTDVNITKINKCNHTEQHAYDGAQNRTQLHFGEPNNKHTRIQQRSNKPQNSPGKRSKKIFNQQLTSMHYLYLQPKNRENVKLYNKKKKKKESQNKRHFFKGRQNLYFSF